MDMIVIDMQELKEKISVLVRVLLKVSPEHRAWLEVNFKEYLDELERE